MKFLETNSTALDETPRFAGSHLGLDCNMTSWANKRLETVSVETRGLNKQPLALKQFFLRSRQPTVIVLKAPSLALFGDKIYSEKQLIYIPFN